MKTTTRATSNSTHRIDANGNAGFDSYLRAKGFRPLTAKERAKYSHIMKEKRIFVERRPEGDYAVRRANAERASAIENTQSKAIRTARKLEPEGSLHVERVRHTSGGGPDKWRKA